jgi:hypothetical protein
MHAQLLHAHAHRLPPYLLMGCCLYGLQVTRLRYTPRRLAIHPEHGTLFVAEADHGAIPLAERADLKERMAAAREAAGNGAVPDVMQVGEGGGVDEWTSHAHQVLRGVQLLGYSCRIEAPCFCSMTIPVPRSGMILA